MKSQKKGQKMSVASESLSNEMALLGSVLMDGERVMPVVLGMGCRAEWFKDARCRTVWCAMKALFDGGARDGMDALTVMDAARGLTEKKGGEEAETAEIGAGFMQELIDVTPTSAHAEYYCCIVRGQYVARKGKRAAQAFATGVEMGAGLAIQKIMAEMHGLLQELTSGACGDDRDEVIDEVMRGFEEAHRVVMVEGGGKVKYCPGLRLPWEHMTQLYSGANPGLHIVSGRPSTGKTALINNLLDYWCGHLGLAGGLNSLDMTRQAMWSRNFSLTSRVSLPKARFGMTSKADMEKLRTAAAALKKWKLDMHVCRDLEEFRSWVTLGVMKRGWRFCVVDFIQLLNFRECTRMSVDDRTAMISGAVKGLGNDLKIPMFALSQLNRECEREGGRPPKASDLRGGGSLEQDAGTVLMLRKDQRCEAAWREFPPKMLTPFGGNDQVQTYLAKRLRPVWAALEKNQDGNTGEMPFVFYKNYFTFRLADYRCSPIKVDRTAKEPAHLDYTPLFCRVHPDWRSHEEDAALAKSGGLVTEYADGED